MLSASTRALRVFLADDHLVVREGLKGILQNEGMEVVGEASDGLAAISLCDSLQPEVAILDVAMPLLNGIDAAREILKHSPTTKIVLLTMYAEEPYILASLRAGIRGYVLKSNTASTLVEAIHAVAKNETYLSPGVSRTVVQAYLSSAAAPWDPLSVRERAVLQLIAEGRTVKEIGGMLGISARTAETHRARIMDKLNVHDIAGLVRYAITHGVIRVEAKVSGMESSVVTNRQGPGAETVNAEPSDGGQNQPRKRRAELEYGEA